MFRRLCNPGLSTSDQPRTRREAHPVLMGLEQRIALSSGRPGESFTLNFEEIKIEVRSESVRPTGVYVDYVVSGMS
ncbi:MAG: hypothetical protein SFX72_08075 [Isosphaeraceae bacterium]|nr:hypothetical protein [Isosphaeraceae bacterium]